MSMPADNYIFMEKQLPEPYQLLNLMSRDGGWHMAEHDHPMFQMIWVIQGTLHISYSGMEHLMRRGDLCIIPPLQRHALRTESGYTQLGFDLTPGADRRGIVSLMESKIKSIVMLDRTDLISIVPGLEEKYRQFSLMAKLQIAHVLDDVLLSCIVKLDSETSFRQQMITLLDQYMDGKVTLSQIAKLMSFSPAQLERITNREFGCSVMELFQRLKLNKACFLLISSELSVKQIADLLGFFDQAHFSRFFKMKMNVTPSQFKKANL
jgi:AraC-like DNA-binding protein/quercetin dioxygenase-like cupin family protein